MSHITPQLRAALQRDATVVTTKRWSLQSLAELATRAAPEENVEDRTPINNVAAEPTTTPTTTRMTMSTSQTLLQCAVQRLAQQHEFLEIWKQQQQHQDVLPTTTTTSATTTTTTRRKLFDTLQYVHADTYQLGRKLLDQAAFWERFAAPERHTVNAVLLELRARHATTLEKAVDLVLLGDDNNNDSYDDNDNCHRCAELFLQRRLGFQLLCDHHVELYRQMMMMTKTTATKQHLGKQHNGAVTVRAPLGPILVDAVLEAQHVVDAHLQIYPETRFYFKDNNNNDTTTTTAPTLAPQLLLSGDCGGGGDYCITVVRPWLHHALVELLKNAMASAVQQMQQQRHHESVPAPIDIIVTAATTTTPMISIEIMDRGTGIAGGDPGIQRALALGHSSTGRRRWDRLQEQQSYAAVRSPLSSLGVGLPTSRYMMEHFGGRLTLRNNNNTDNNNTDSGSTGCTARIELPVDCTILERLPGVALE